MFTIKNNTKIYLPIITFSFLIAQASLADNTTVLDEINVVDEAHLTQSQKIYKKSGAVSIVGKNRDLQSLDSTIRALPGTYTTQNQQQGTLTINIRGMSGFGRVNTMIDDVPQTFYGTTASDPNSPYHAESALGTSQFGAMIDPNFLVKAEITRGFAEGSQGINALSGSANLHTIGVNDVLFHNKNIGVYSKLGYGSNGEGKNGMLAVAGRTDIFDQGMLGAMFAISGSNSTANYKRGDGSYSNLGGQFNSQQHSWLSKIELVENNQNKSEISISDYKNNIGGRQIRHQNYSFKHNYNPQSNLINLDFLAAYSKSPQIYPSNATIGTLNHLQTQNISHYFDLKNNINIELGDLNWKLQLGANLFKNKYSKSVIGVDQDNIDNTPFSPAGKQNFKSLYLTNQFDYANFLLNLGLIYTDGHLVGHKPACDTQDLDCFPRGAATLDLRSKKLQPSVMLSYQANDWFKPFISYSRSTRLPNPQEVFFNFGLAGAINPYLKPEQATTYQLGFNTDKIGIFSQNDFLGIKLVGYVSYIKNYIFSQIFYIDNGHRQPTYGDNTTTQIQLYTNAINTIKHRGIELNLNYDTDVAFLNLAYSRQYTNSPIDATAALGGAGTQRIATLPKDVATLNIGGRFFERKLTIGSIFKHTGKSQRIIPLDATDDEFGSGIQEMPKIPLIIDLYATYKINPNIEIKASIQNLTNRNYVNALNQLNSDSSNTTTDDNDNYVYLYSNSARGRTYLIGATIRF